MLRRFVLPLILLLPLLSSAPARQASADVNSSLFAFPSEGHSGNTLWLSGSGLQPLAQYIIFMGCPNWFDPTVVPDQNYIHFVGPTTDANGQFIREPIQVLQLHHKSSSGCIVYAAQATDTGFGPNVPAIYSIVPHSQQLPKCAVQICGSVTTAPNPARAGQLEALVVHGWGGATANMTIDFGGRGVKPLHKSFVLYASGSRPISVRIPSQATKVTTASISVSFHLSHVTGTAKQVDFTIER
jgi:hypothetical protein